MKKSFEDRFWEKVDRRGLDECWPWKAYKDHGYGRFVIFTKGSWIPKPAHRVAYELLVGPIPEGLYIDHLCRNPSCVNPRHMEPVTRKENILRGICPPAINAQKTHCSHGHPFTDENVYPSSTGHRICKTCKRRRLREYYQRKRKKKT